MCIRDRDNTYIIFTSDHGLSVGQHGLIGKQSLYDHSIRVPMIISGPKIKPNSKYNSDIYLQDIVPTTYDLAKIPVSDEVDFKSFYQTIIDNKNEKIHPAIYGTFGCCQSDYFDFQRMIRRDNFKLMLFPKNKRLELYNLENDPFETENLISNYENKILVQSMFEELINLQKKYEDTLNLKRIFNDKIYN